MRLKAHTLAEALMVLAIAGVLMVITLNSMNSKHQTYSAQYYNAYDSLSKAAFNMYNDTNCSMGDCTEAEKIKGRAFPTSVNGLCRRLTEYINSSNKFCSAGDANSNAVDPDTPIISESNVQFIANNSFKYYISPVQSYQDSNGKDIKYFVVYIDLNGKQGPNSTTYVDSKKEIVPDIVPFAVTTTGDVVPMGVALTDNRYMTARVGYADDSGSSGNELEGNYSDAMTFKEARAKAFGCKEYYDMPQTLRFRDSSPCNSSAIDTNHGCKEGLYTCLVRVTPNQKR